MCTREPAAPLVASTLTGHCRPCLLPLLLCAGALLQVNANKGYDPLIQLPDGTERKV